VKVPVIGANFVRLAEQALKKNHSHIGYLEALVAMETEGRNGTRSAGPSLVKARRNLIQARRSPKCRLIILDAKQGGLGHREPEILPLCVAQQLFSFVLEYLE
jgi:hypothetical protein